jgi:hypothetical protein
LTFPVAGDEPARAVVTYVADAGKPACYSSSMILPQPGGLFDYQTPVLIQQKLDEQIQVYQQCVQTENARQGAEDALIKDINQIVTQLTTELGKIDDAYQSYAASGNPLAHKYEGYLGQRKRAVFLWQTDAVQLQLVAQERARRLKDLNRQQGILTDRQAAAQTKIRRRFDFSWATCHWLYYACRCMGFSSDSDKPGRLQLLLCGVS